MDLNNDSLYTHELKNTDEKENKLINDGHNFHLKNLQKNNKKYFTVIDSNDDINTDYLRMIINDHKTIISYNTKHSKKYIVLF